MAIASLGAFARFSQTSVFAARWTNMDNCVISDVTIGLGIEVGTWLPQVEFGHPVAPGHRSGRIS